MKYQEYQVTIEQKFSFLNQDDLLFWNLWCLNYVFEKIECGEYKHYESIKTAYMCLWDYNDGKINNLDSIFSNQSVKDIMNFDNDEFKNLDNFNIQEKSIQEMIVGLESIFGNLIETGKIIYNASELPINVVDIEIDGISITTDNNSIIYLDLVKSQFKLLDKLSETHTKFTFKDRNIYRNERNTK